MTSTAKKLLSVFDERRAHDTVKELLASAGVIVGGDAPWDIRVHDDRMYTRMLRDGTLGVGESYMEGWWDCDAIDEMLTRVIRARVDLVVRESWVLLAQFVRAKLLNLQAARAFEVGKVHYDVGNDLYRAMLGPRMIYTCGYFKDTDDLDAAQDAKLDLVCRKIGAAPGMRVLDLGCGWGGFAAFAAERYGAHVTGYTVSREQVAWANEHHAHLPIDIRLDDYRNATGKYDAVISIGLMEHVGPKNHRAYMEHAAELVVPGGPIFVHTIGANRPQAQIDPWFGKYIFPNAAIPTMGQLTTAMDDLLTCEDVHNIGPHYDKTLMAWMQRFNAAWPSFREHYGDTFYRMWKFYLLASAAGFRTRYLNLFQIVATVWGNAQPPAARSV
jgi:cyclopropane-fatty-acyl-phospholipid synthase